MSIKGTFESYYSSGLLKLLNSEKKSGELVIKKGKDETTVYLAEGNVVYATSTLKELRLGTFLISQEIITPEQYDMCTEISKARKSPLGKILLEKGYLTSVELKQIIGEQIEQIIFNLLLWEKGDFEFVESDTPHKGVDITPINILNLIEDASQRIEEMTILLKQIPNDQIVFKMADVVDGTGEIKLNANEWRILALVNGHRNVRELVAESGFEEFEVYKVLSSLLATGHIQENKSEHDTKKDIAETQELDLQENTKNDQETVIEESTVENKLTPEKIISTVKPDKSPEQEVKKEEIPDEKKEIEKEIQKKETVKENKLKPKVDKTSKPSDMDDSKRIDISESDVSEIVMVYIDILKPVQKILENELGMEAFAIIDDSKRQLNSHQKRVLKNFRAENPSASNIHEIIDAISESPDIDEGYELIILSFNSLIQKVLLRVPDILGVQPTRKMLQEIERVIYHIDNEQSGVIQKASIIEGIKDILLETERVLSKQ